MQVLVVRKHRMTLGAKEIRVPHVDKAHERHDVLLERRLAEVAVNVVEAGEELLEDLGTKGDDEREAHRRVHGVAPANPAPEAKGVLRVDAKVLDELEVGGDGHKVMLHGVCHGGVRAIDCTGGLKTVEQPRLGLTRVGHGLERGERLGDDNHQRGLGVEALDLLGHVIGVDVGDVAHVNARVGVGLEGLVHHDRAEVGAADANGDHILDGLAGDALPLAGAHALRKGVHTVENLVDVGHAILPVNHELAGICGRAAKSRVQHGAVLGGVDVRAREHGVAMLFDAHLAREVAQELDGLFGHEVLGEVKVEIVQIVGELAHAVCVVCKPLLEANAICNQLVVVILKRLPSGCLGGVDGCGNIWHGAAPCRDGQHTVQGYRVCGSTGS